jgi:hypothetical protein
VTADILLDLCAPDPPATDDAEARRATVVRVLNEIRDAEQRRVGDARLLAALGEIDDDR